MAVKFNKNFNINRVVKALVRTILALYVGGTILSVFGEVMLNTSSAFYSGLTLIGWTTETTLNATSIGSCGALAELPAGGLESVPNCITDVSGSGVLAVIGIIAIAQIVLEFISW
jgi:hypothetical protein